ncbi:hypothetical protein DTO217A2_3347 [Paecilomyces variotii]|nr:hypothetical protein DTO217A2_3347 [Paecilomyces variotii]
MIPYRWRRFAVQCTMDVLPPLNFLTLHYTYFIATVLGCSLVFWGAATPFGSVAYVDALYMCASAMTGAGLNTVNLSTLNTFQQLILFLLIVFGSAILVSSVVLFVRKQAFERKLKGILKERHSVSHCQRSGLHIRLSHLRRKPRSPQEPGDVDTDLGDQFPDGKRPVVQSACISTNGPSTTRANASGSIISDSIHERPHESQSDQIPHDDDHIQWIDDDQVTIGGSPRPRRHSHRRVFPMAGVGARPDLNNHPRDILPDPLLYEARRPSLIETALKGTQKYFLSKGFISRNSQFYGLTPSERGKLGGVEYRAVSFLSIIVPLYFVLFHVFGIVGVGSWISMNRPDIARTNGLSPFWVGAFFATSAFGNSGMALLDANMTALQTSAYCLLTMGMLILAGNTLYPCFLRFIIWSIRRMLPNKEAWQDWRVVLDFILDHPRRVYTNLFPARHTWYLLGTIIFLNGIDWMGFEVLSIGNNEIDKLPPPYRVLDGLFQALAVRSGGFYVVNIANLRQGLLVLYALMMYVSAFPVLVTIRNTNVYEERSLGIYADDNQLSDPENRARSVNPLVSLLRHHLLPNHQESPPAVDLEASRSYFVRQQLRSQLSHDIWWIALAVLFITIAESGHFEKDPISFSTFNIIFEVVSAYGCVGLSVGFPNQNYSFSGTWHPISKLILAAVMIRGRHRGLPVAIDKAIMLPSESLAWAEEEDAALRIERSRTRSVGKTQPSGPAAV